ncbi:NACHT domain-containing protein [Micromonospora ureilytica]|uniref:DNA polymerase III delta prime subunit n=1 Tax=Micromonospora ureilytica TaxID=709868 RepID=A0ABS0JD77_9ACTN|nr:hypothetical protein [Micromonospora ureilytica]MBG6065008.1 DNA polymerase III delta prime subunit [Micromonospora ureilytica]
MSEARAVAEPGRQRLEFAKQVKYRLMDQGLDVIYEKSPRMELNLSVSSDTSPSSSSIVDIFANARVLLIYGEAGAGKTVALLELARDLLARFESDPRQPIPVVLHLASWPEKQPPFRTWLASEVSRSYLVPLVVAKAWIDEDVILPLLDGIDSAPGHCRSRLIRSINEYVIAGPKRLALTGRTEEINECEVRLAVIEEVEILPPDERQVRNYLKSLKMKRQDIAQLVPIWKNEALLTTPLMLSIASQVGLTAIKGAFSLDGKAACARAAIFDEYLDRMLPQVRFTHANQEGSEGIGRTGPNDERHHNATFAQLSTIARWMKDSAQVEFHIDRIQPSILSAPRLWSAVMAAYWFMVGFTPIALSIAIVTITAPAKATADDRGFITSMSLLGAGLVGLLMVLAGLLSRHDRVVRSSYQSILNGAPRRGLHWTILLTESTTWSWRTARQRAPLFGFILLAQTPMYFLLDLHGPEGAVWAASLLVLFSVGVGRTPGLLQRRPRFNEGVTRTIKRIFPYSALVFLYGFWVFFKFGGLWAGAAFGTTMFVMAAMLGGYPVVQHYLLRMLLALRGDIQFQIRESLESCVERNILRRCAGGYRFIHPLFQEHFASRQLGERD